MRVWIVGGSGLLGTTVEKMCKRHKIFCRATSRKQVDITHCGELQRFAEAFCPTHVINCAAYTDVDRAEKEPKEAYKVNALGPEYLAAIAKRRAIRLIHISTDYVFGGKEDSPFDERERCLPIGIYAKSKWEGEKRVLAENAAACIIRTSWLFGVGGKNFLSNLFQKLLLEETVHVVQDQKSRPTFCSDLSEAILALLCHSGVYHFANTGELSRYQMAHDMWEEAKKRRIQVACRSILPASLTQFPGAPRPHYSVLNTNKIEAVLGKRPRSWNAVLSEYMDQLCAS